MLADLIEHELERPEIQTVNVNDEQRRQRYRQPPARTKLCNLQSATSEQFWALNDVSVDEYEPTISTAHLHLV